MAANVGFLTNMRKFVQEILLLDTGREVVRCCHRRVDLHPRILALVVCRGVSISSVEQESHYGKSTQYARTARVERYQCRS